MKINSISNITFRNRIKVNLPNKSLGNKNYFDGPLGKVVRIADKNKSTIFIGEDIIIIGSSQSIKNDLKQAGFSFEEIGDEV